MAKAQLTPEDFAEEGVDRLLELCFERRCPLELLLHHLHSSFDKRGIRDFILNHLFETEASQLLFYVPEVVYMALTSPPCALEALVLNLCSASTEAFILVCWTLSAWSHDLTRRRLMKKSMEKSLALCEERWLSAADAPELRALKADFWSVLNVFIKKLTGFSLYLKAQPADGRKRMLKTLIKSLNNFLISRRRACVLGEQPLRALTQGVIVPFTFTENPGSNLVVGILSEEVGCFETKKRCPYKIVFECIAAEELGLRRENESKAQGFVISEEEERETSDFRHEEGRSEVKEARDSGSRSDKFSELNDFAIRKRIEEQGLEGGGEAAPAPPREKSEVISEGHRLSFFPPNSPLFRQFDRPFKQKRDEDELEEARRCSGSSTDERRRRARSASPLPQHLTFEEAESRINFLLSMCQKHSSGANTVFNTRSPREIEKLQHRTVREQLIQNQKISAKAEFESKFLKKVFAKPWRGQFEGFRRQSSFGHFESYSLKAVIVKGGDDLRQEIVAMQLMKKFAEIFEREQTNCYVRPYEIVVTSKDAGFLEFLADTMPVDELKKLYKLSLAQIYRKVWGAGLESARKCFIESLAGYSLYSYLLQIKDRHNGNIMVSHQGHLLHIDFGFLFSTSPGNINFENAPFKFTADYLELLAGEDSDFFAYFRQAMRAGLRALQKNLHELLNIVKIMSHQSLLPCFEKFSLSEFEERFKAQLDEQATSSYVDRLIRDSMHSKRTVWYDEFQKITNRIEP